MSETPAESCSAACLAAGEPLAGTASDARYFAAISWPKALWHADKIARSEGLPEDIAELEMRMQRSQGRLQLRLFQRAAFASIETVEIVCVDFASGRTAQLRGVPAERGANLIAEFLAGEPVGSALECALLLVCSDGRHDLCCGKLGRSLVQALRADGRIDVAETSHLGGHRLAANCLALPSGDLYGRVGAADVPALVESVRHSRVYLPRYRGRSGLDELAQVAEAAALAEFPSATGIRIGAPASDGGARLVPVELRDGDAIRRLSVRCVVRTFEAISSCGDAEPERRERLALESVREAER